MFTFFSWLKPHFRLPVYLLLSVWSMEGFDESTSQDDFLRKMVWPHVSVRSTGDMNTSMASPGLLFHSILEFSSTG